MQILTRRTFYWLSSLFLALTLSFLLPWPRAHADGGAPNLSYVAGTSHSISIIDVLQQRVINTIPIGGDPHTVLLSLDGSILYVSQPTLGRVALLDTKTEKTICTVNLPGQPSLLALDPRPEINVLYAAGNGASTISVLNPTTCALQHTFKTKSPVYGLAVAFIDPSKGYQLWVADKTSLLVFDERTGRQLATIPISGGPEYLCIPSDTAVYVTTRQGKVFVVDIDTTKVSLPLLTNGKFGPMDYNADTGEVYVPDQQHNLLDILSPIYRGVIPPPQPRRTIQMDAPPQSVAISSDGQLGFVTLHNGKVVMLDIPGRRMVKSIFVGGDPRFIITGLYPPTVGPTRVAASTPQETFPWGTLMDIALGVLVITLLVIPTLLIWRKRS